MPLSSVEVLRCKGFQVLGWPSSYYYCCCLLDVCVFCVTCFQNRFFTQLAESQKSLRVLDDYHKYTSRLESFLVVFVLHYTARG
jgi:hypothetical protein